MGGVGNFLFGGSKQKSGSSQQSSSTQTSQNQSTQKSAQGSASSAANFQKSGNVGFNQAYAPVAAALTPTLGYTQQAGDAMAALLGLPANSFSYNQQPYSPPASVLPSGPNPTAPPLPNLKDVIGQVNQALPPEPAPPTTPTPTTPTVPTTPTTPTTPTAPTTPSVAPDNLYSAIRHLGMIAAKRETGGPVRAGEPYIVGEKRPELFVPQQDGVILPKVPRNDGMMNTFGGALLGNNSRGHRNPFRERLGGGNAGGNTGIVPPVVPTTPTTTTTPATPATPAAPNYNTALSNFADSGGMNFILDQGQKAISGASAANGVFNSGATGMALQEYGQNLGKTYLQQYMDQLSKLSQIGLGSASALSGAGGVNIGQSSGGGTSSSIGGSVGSGQSSGSSIGSSTSTGTSSGKGNSKNGLFPALLG